MIQNLEAYLVHSEWFNVRWWWRPTKQNRFRHPNWKEELSPIILYYQAALLNQNISHSLALQKACIDLAFRAQGINRPRYLTGRNQDDIWPRGSLRRNPIFNSITLNLFVASSKQPRLSTNLEWVEDLKCIVISPFSSDFISSLASYQAKQSVEFNPQGDRMGFQKPVSQSINKRLKIYRLN